MSEEACKWKCVSVQRSARAIVKAETQNMNAGIHISARERDRFYTVSQALKG